jgi:hypothetical protein
LSLFVSARREGLAITANMYCYTAGAAPVTPCRIVRDSQCKFKT